MLTPALPCCESGAVRPDSGRSVGPYVILFFPMCTPIPRRAALLSFLLLMYACGQQSTTLGLGDPCTSDGQCAAGQACLLTREELVERNELGYAQEETAPVVQTCQIPCFRDVECPSGFKCEGEAIGVDEQDDGTVFCLRVDDDAQEPEAD